MLNVTHSHSLFIHTVSKKIVDLKVNPTKHIVKHNFKWLRYSSVIRYSLFDSNCHHHCEIILSLKEIQHQWSTKSKAKQMSSQKKNKKQKQKAKSNKQNLNHPLTNHSKLFIKISNSSNHIQKEKQQPTRSNINTIQTQTTHQRKLESIILHPHTQQKLLQQNAP